MTEANTVFAVTVPAQAHNLKAVRDFFETVLGQAGVSEIEELLLAIDEACANVIRHRREDVDDGQISVKAELDAQCIRLRIANYCGESDVPRIRPRKLSDVRPGGLGTSFIAQIMDHVEYEREPDCDSGVALLMTRELCPDRDSHE